MGLEDKKQPVQLSDDDLLNVSGGCTIQNERGEEVKEGRFVTSKFASYSSGDRPKYAIGDFLKIKWRIGADLEVPCNVEIMGVNEDKSGLLFRKFTYSVKILSCPNSDVIGMIESDVQENCLFL